MLQEKDFVEKNAILKSSGIYLTEVISFEDSIKLHTDKM